MATPGIMKVEKSIEIRLDELLEGIYCEHITTTGTSITICSISADSRSVIPGTLFVAIEGAVSDGKEFISQAVENGAAAVMVDGGAGLDWSECELNGVAVILVDDTKTALGMIASRFYNSPAEHMTMIGITGTNGKTTVSYLMEHVLAVSGIQVGVIGTINYRYRNRDGQRIVTPASFTTPDPVVLFRVLHEMSVSGVTHVLMEVSSHALAQKRVGPLCFSLSLFTNLSQDHLDYHHNMEDYFAAKCLLFSEKMVPGSRAVIYEPEAGNRQKRIWSDKLGALCDGRGLETIRCGKSEQADYKLVDFQVKKSGISFSCSDPDGITFQVSSPLIGRFNIENLLVSVAALEAIGLERELICAHLSQAVGAPGRLQHVQLPARSEEMPVVLVDYAHTPDALENVLAAAQALPHRSLICVFGCGGDRDRSKRSLMGDIAVQYSDLAIITDDNPRSEDPARIRKDIVDSKKITTENLKDQDWLTYRNLDEKGCVEIAGRAQAIKSAVHQGCAEDIVLIAGKGHEQYQITSDGKIFFDDCLCAQQSSLTWNTDLIVAAAGGEIKNPGKGQPFNKISTDSRSIEENDVFVALKGDAYDGHSFLAKGIQGGAACLVVSDTSEVPEHVGCVQVENTLTALGDLASWRRQALKRITNPVVVGITGSCGKTTVKEMTASIFSKFWPEQPDKPQNRVLKTTGNFNNLVGLPLSLLPGSVYHDAIILEMGMNQPGEIDRLTEIADPDIACITNVHGAHLEGLGTIENVARAKAELFNGTRESGVLVVNLDDERIVAHSQKCTNERRITYAVTDTGLEQRPDVWTTGMAADGTGNMSFILHVDSRQGKVVLQAPGLHNCSNSCAAAAISLAAGVDFQSIVSGLESFRSPMNRMETIKTGNGLNILNDSYNANPASMKSALDTLKTIDSTVRIAIIGDMLELGADAEQLHVEIGCHAAESAIDFLAVVGDFGVSVADGAKSCGMDPKRVLIFDNKQRVVDWVDGLLHTEQLHPEDWILVKASRGLALDTIVGQLVHRC